MRRLAADQASLEEYVRLHPRVKLVAAEGEPPEKYQLEYAVRSLRQVGDDLRVIKSHLVEITLPRNYPRTPPQCRMMSPVFHPNIAPHAICVGDHWSAGESLKSIVVRIGEMLAYQSYNVKSPLNGEAARWVEENQDRLPLDDVSMLPEERAGFDNDEELAPRLRKPAPRTATSEDADSPEPKRTAAEPRGSADQAPVNRTQSKPAESNPGESRLPDAQPGAQIKIDIECSHCGTTYKVPIEYRGKKVRCKNCRETFAVP